ncbi:hypothetical protein EVAR_34593_1 [Eumeta japonica]|uniref:Uncharacterized protein n=1 Tax=Eumeta variegata TaxID=151549 RepID=A0A4C1VEK4_EUMVA|nr:hypothetical protein EVAR_34593_1 [Eumeta japonica]
MSWVNAAQRHYDRQLSFGTPVPNRCGSEITFSTVTKKLRLYRKYATVRMNAGVILSGVPHSVKYLLNVEEDSNGGLSVLISHYCWDAVIKDFVDIGLAKVGAREAVGNKFRKFCSGRAHLYSSGSSGCKVRQL